MSKNTSDKTAPKKYTKKELDAMTMEERAVLVAKDVLLQLKLKTLTAMGGAYLELKNDEEYKYTHIVDAFPKNMLNWDAQKQIDKIAEKCQVCAIGSVFLSSVRLFDKMKVGQVLRSYSWDMTNHMKDIFNFSDLDKMESAFEGGWGLTREEAGFDLATQEMYEHRLKAIMNNVIKNNGKFVPIREL